MRLRRAIDNAVGSRAFGAAISSGEGSRRKVRLPQASAVRSTTSCWRRRPRARVDADQSEERADVSEIFSVAQSHPPPRGKRELLQNVRSPILGAGFKIGRSNPRAGRSLMHGVAPQLCRSSSPPIVRRRSRGSLPRLHLSEDKRQWSPLGSRSGHLEKKTDSRHHSAAVRSCGRGTPPSSQSRKALWPRASATS